MMLMPPFTLHHPQSVDEAVGLAGDLISKGEAFDWGGRRDGCPPKLQVAYQSETTRYFTCRHPRRALSLNL